MKTSVVGPILVKGEMTDLIVSALKELNETAEITDRGAYYRVEVEGTCLLTRECLEKYVQKRVDLHLVLDSAMTSFVGIFSWDEDHAEWSANG